MEREKKLLIFYNELVKLSQNDVARSKSFFEEAIIVMLFSHELKETFLLNKEIYEILLLLNILSDDYKLKNEKENFLYPFNIVDENYFVNLIRNMDNLQFLRLQYIGRILDDILSNNEIIVNLVKKARPELVEAFYCLNRLTNIMRQGWIKRGVDEKYYESDSMHIMQMIAFANAYLRTYNELNIDELKLYEMILIHETGEIIAGDIREGTKAHENKYEKEKLGLIKTFGQLNSRDYFINLWEEFESRNTDEASLAYKIDKIDPIIKAKYLDKQLNRNDLLDDFYSYEEQRGTFENSNFKKIMLCIK